MKIFKKVPLTSILFFLSVWSTFSFIGIKILDPDFGWQLKMGQRIMQSGVPRLDPFSYTMPSYVFVDHEWLVSALIALVYPHIGMAGLSLLFALFATVAIVISAGFFRKPGSHIFFILSSLVFLPFFGVRAQVFTWFFFAILMWSIDISRKRQKFHIALPFLFIVWANMHAGFSIGIALLCFFLLFDFIISKKISLVNCVIWFLCILGTLINPYGYNLWGEVWRVSSSPLLRNSIAEWQPALFSPFNIALWFFLSLSISFIILYWKKFSLLEKILYTGLLFAGLFSIRHIPLWTLVALPLVIQSYGFLLSTAQAHRYGIQKLRILYKGFILLVFLIAGLEIFFMMQELPWLSEKYSYPEQAVAFVHNRMPKGEIFSTYNWGGYLIWKLPEKKVFVDGRMPSWQNNNPPKGESTNALFEYIQIISGKISVKTAIKKYHISLFLLPVEHPTGPPSALWQQIEKYLERAVYGDVKENTGNFVKDIQQMGFREVYKDNIAVVYDRK